MSKNQEACQVGNVKGDNGRNLLGRDLDGGERRAPTSSVNDKNDVCRPSGTAQSVQEVAKALGATDRTVWGWLKAGAPKPAKKGGGYDLGAIWDWVQANINPNKVHNVPSTGTPLGDARMRKMEAEIRLLEIEEKERLRQLVPVEDAQQIIRLALLPFRDALVGMPDALAARCNPADPEHARIALEEWRTRVMRLVQKEVGP